MLLIPGLAAGLLFTAVAARLTQVVFVGVNVAVHFRESVEEADRLRTELVARGVKSWLVKADFDDGEAPGRLISDLPQL